MLDKKTWLAMGILIHRKGINSHDYVLLPPHKTSHAGIRIKNHLQTVATRLEAQNQPKCLCKL